MLNLIAVSHPVELGNSCDIFHISQQVVHISEVCRGHNKTEPALLLPRLPRGELSTEHEACAEPHKYVKISFRFHSSLKISLACGKDRNIYSMNEKCPDGCVIVCILHRGAICWQTRPVPFSISRGVRYCRPEESREELIHQPSRQCHCVSSLHTQIHWHVWAQIQSYCHRLPGSNNSGQFPDCIQKLQVNLL